MSKLTIDLNCDMGEEVGDDAALMPFITAANIACGVHAGGRDVMKRTVALCLEHGVRIGAHPSYPDREHFGRRDLIPSAFRLSDLPALIGEQVELMREVCREEGAVLHHVKLHGALYNRAARDEEAGQLICAALSRMDARLVLYGLSGSRLAGIAAAYGLPFLHEVFADRTYLEDGSLTPRTEWNALLKDEEAAVRQVLQMVRQGAVTATTGKVIPVVAETVCIHGDGPMALPFARALNRALLAP